MPNSGINDEERKIKGMGPYLQGAHRFVEIRPVADMENMDRIPLAECRRHISKEYLGLPGRVHSFTEEREKGKEEFVG